jgi:TolB protein
MATGEIVYDNLELIDVPATFSDGIDGSLIVYTVTNDSESITNLSTAQPGTNVEVLYYGSPTSSLNRTAIAQFDASATGGFVFPAQQGNAVAYFANRGGLTSPGLYILDIEFGLRQRILAVDSLVLRGIETRPVWSPDGNLLAVTRETGFDLDIFIFNRQTSIWENLTQSGSYDLWPAFSPDGRFLAFVSDRNICPTWIPGQTGACDPDVDLFDGGHIFTYNLETGELNQLTDQITTEPPYWINNRQIAFSGGNQFDILSQTRTLWQADVVTGQSRQVNYTSGTQLPFLLTEIWSPAGNRVIFQSAGDNTNIVITDASGSQLVIVDQASFARFSMRASWSPDGSRLVIGGFGGQCPTGTIVLDGSTFDTVTRRNPPPSVCNPMFSPDGQYIAFEGINPQTTGDGRTDIYVTNPNGVGNTNITGDLGGSVELIGWVGGG